MKKNVDMIRKSGKKYKKFYNSKFLHIQCVTCNVRLKLNEQVYFVIE